MQEYMLFIMVCVSKNICHSQIRLCPHIPTAPMGVGSLSPLATLLAPPPVRRRVWLISKYDISKPNYENPPPPPPPLPPVPTVLQCSEARYLHMQVHGRVLG